MEADEERAESFGAWEAWKRSAAAFVRSAGALASIRWEMATREAGAWGKAMALRAAFLVIALVFLVLASALLVAGLVAVLAAWWGTWIGAIFAVLGICVLVAAGLVFAAVRRAGRPLLRRTAAELRRDFETFSGPEP